MLNFSHAVVPISPVHRLLLAGRPESRTWQTKHDELEANIVVMSAGNRRAVFVSVDALFVGARLSDEIVRACAGIDPSAVVIVASHTHSAPALEATKPLLGLGNADHIAITRERIVAGIGAALGAVPSRGAAFRGECLLHAGVNRRRPWPFPRLTSQGIRFDGVVMAPNANGRVNPKATAIILQGDNQTAVIWHYACHPTDFPDDSAVSADYPGVVRAALREKYGPQTAVVFLQGFAGDIRPPGGHGRWTSRARSLATGPRFHRMSYAQWRTWSTDIANAILGACDNSRPIRGELLRSARAEMPLSRLLRGSPPDRRIEAQQLLLLDQRVLMVSAEPLVGLQTLCSPDCLCVGYSRDVFGYWPLAEDIPFGGYEVDGYKKGFGVEYEWCADSDAVFSELTSFGDRLHSGDH